MARAVELVVLAAVLVLCWPSSLGGSVSLVEVDGHSMLPTYHSGDLLVTRAAGGYVAGQVVVYAVPQGEVGAGRRVVHRIVGGNGDSGFDMRGDNNSYLDPWHPRSRDVVGRVVLHVPAAGAWFTFLARPVNLGILCGSTTITCMLWPREPARRRGRRARRTTDVSPSEPNPAPPPLERTPTRTGAGSQT